jgi:hypothetical protein
MTLLVSGWFYFSNSCGVEVTVTYSFKTFNL